MPVRQASATAFACEALVSVVAATLAQQVGYLRVSISFCDMQRSLAFIVSLVRIDMVGQK